MTFSTSLWGGLVSDLAENRTHIAIADLTMTKERLKLVDFTIPISVADTIIYTKRPTAKESNIFSFLAPFPNNIWLAIVGSFVFFFALLMILQIMLERKFKKSIFWNSISFCVGQSLDNFPE